MNTWFVMNLLIIGVMQFLAQVAMKYGSGGRTPLRSGRWWLGFVLANAVWAPCMLFVRLLYKALPDNPNLVAALFLASTFTICQAGLAVIFRSRPTRFQVAGIALVAVGSALAVLGG